MLPKKRHFKCEISKRIKGCRLGEKNDVAQKIFIESSMTIELKH
jgi:hypothetical protein